MENLIDDYKTKSDEKTFLQSQINQSFDNQSRPQTSLSKLPSPPSLQFQKHRYKFKKETIEQKPIENKSILDNIKKANARSYIQKAIIQYLLNTDKVIDCYRQISQQELIQLFYDTMKLQKDYINAFQPQWVQLMKTNVETYFAFQNKMMLLYLQNCNIYFKNIYDMKIIEQKKGEGEKDQKILL